MGHIIHWMIRNKIKQILRENLLSEAAPEIKDLRTVAHTIYDSLIEQAAHEAAEDANKLDMALSSDKDLERNTHVAENFFKNKVLTIEGDKKFLYDLTFLDVGDEIKDFVHNYVFPTLRIGFVHSNEPDLEKGYFAPNKNVLIVTYPAFNTDKEILQAALANLEDKYGKEGYNGIFEKAIKEDLFSQQDAKFYRRCIEDAFTMLNNQGKAMASTLLHELQHAYDHYRSEGKFNKVDPEKSEKLDQAFKTDQKLGQERLNQLYKDYMNLPHEVWARFSQAIDALESKNMIQGQDFNKVKEEFEKVMDGYKDLKDKMKKRILKTLYKYWDDEQGSDDNKR